MKKLSLLLAIMMIALVFAVPASAATANGSYGEVPLYKGEITIDGQIDEVYTEYGLKIDCTLDFDGSRYQTDTEAWIYLLHDGKYLYVTVDVKDPYDIDVTQYPAKNANAANSWRSSGLEFFLDWKNSGTEFAKYQVWIDGRAWTEGTAKTKEAEYIGEIKTTYDVRAGKYVLELKLPFMENAKIGSEIGLNAMISSSNALATGNQDHVCCTTPGNSAIVAKYKNFTLSATEVKLPEVTTAETTAETPAETTAETTAETKPTESPATGDPMLILAIVAAVSGAGIVLTKKR